MNLHRISPGWQPSPKPMPEGQMIFAVGDIHGFLHLLVELRQLIQEEIEAHPDQRCTVIFIGDYIDRGPDALGVLRFLTEDWQHPSVDSIYLCGNHDHFLKTLLGAGDSANSQAQLENLDNWLINGGDEAMASFGIHVLDEPIADLGRLRDRVAAALGPDVLAFLDQLKLFHREGAYVFVHAGVDPRWGLVNPNPEDLLWIRNSFLDAGAHWRHPYCVVHGHTPSCPEILPHRIGVDTGVYLSNALSAVQLTGGQARFLTVAEVPDGSWQNSVYAGRPVAYALLPPARRRRKRKSATPKPAASEPTSL